MVRLKPEKNLYYNKGISRRKQIYRWFGNVINSSSVFTEDIRQNLVMGEFEEAYRNFVLTVESLIVSPTSYENGDTLMYLIYENIQQFGKTTIMKDLYKNAFLPNFRFKTIVPKKSIHVKRTTIENFTKIRATVKKKYGYNPLGKRKQARVNIYYTTNKRKITILRDIKTGRFLKQPKNFKP